MNTADLNDVWARSGFNYSVLTRPNVEMLAGLLSVELSLFAIDGGLEMYVADKTIFEDKFGVVFCEITVDGTYFKGRDGFSFNRDGSITIAGWTATRNFAPFEKAFLLWMEWLKEEMS